MNALTDHIRHESERGVMLRVLTDWKLDWGPFHELRLQLMSRLGYRMPENQILFHLEYLVQYGYAETRRLRPGRTETDLTAVRATSKAVDLFEGRIPMDPSIGF